MFSRVADTFSMESVLLALAVLLGAVLFPLWGIAALRSLMCALAFALCVTLSGKWR